MNNARFEVQQQDRELKRKIETERDFEEKRVKLATQPNSHNKRPQTLSLKHSSVMGKVKALLDLVSSSVWALPFLTAGQEPSHRPRSIGGVKVKIERLEYSDTTEIVEDLDNILSTPPQIAETRLIVNGGEVRASRQDVDMMAKQLKQKLK